LKPIYNLKTLTPTANFWGVEQIIKGLAVVTILKKWYKTGTKWAHLLGAKIGTGYVLAKAMSRVPWALVPVPTFALTKMNSCSSLPICPY